MHPLGQGLEPSRASRPAGSTVLLLVSLLDRSPPARAGPCTVGSLFVLTEDEGTRDGTRPDTAGTGSTSWAGNAGLAGALPLGGIPARQQGNRLSAEGNVFACSRPRASQRDAGGRGRARGEGAPAGTHPHGHSATASFKVNFQTLDTVDRDLSYWQDPERPTEGTRTTRCSHH